MLLRALLPALCLTPVLISGLTSDPTPGDLQPERALDRFERAVREQLDLNEFELVELELPTGQSQELHLHLLVEGRPLVMDLARTSIRAPGFRALESRADGSLTEVQVRGERTFAGTVRGWPGAMAAGGLSELGFKGAIIPAEGEVWFLEPVRSVDPSAPRALHVLHRGSGTAFGPGACGGGLALGSSPGGGIGLDDPGPQGGAVDCAKQAELAFDVDFERYTALGSTVQGVLDDLDAVMVVVNAIYARDLLIHHVTSTVIVRTSEPDPYTTLDPGQLLNRFRDEWNANQVGTPRDTAHLVTGRQMNGNIIGLAWVGVVCNLPWAYGLSEFTFSFGTHVTLIGHEVGHNWNAPHCDGLEGCGMMCGGCHEFTPTTTAIIQSFAASRTCLDDSAGYSAPVPPRAFDDETITQGPVVLDVLANDHDGNCDPLSIDAFDAVTTAGGTVQLSPGTGPGGRDELAYAPPVGYQGGDFFTYTLGDGQGGTDVGTVVAHVFDMDLDLVLHLKLNESPPSAVMLDSSAFVLDGKFFGFPFLGEPGAAPGTDTSVRFDGIDGRGRHQNLSPPAGLRENLTIALWMRPQQVTGWRRLYGNSGSWALAQVTRNLVFTTAGEKDYFSPVVLTANVWHHVAAVFDPNFDVTFYVNGAKVSKVPGTAPSRAAKGGWHVASRGNLDQFYEGWLDDIQLYDQALTPDQIKFLFEHPGLTVDGDCVAQNYCVTSPNSVGPGAEITTIGSTSVTANDLVLSVAEAPPNQFGLFFYGAGQTQVPVGDGQLCVGGKLFRLPVVKSDVFGFANWSLDLGAPPLVDGLITAGSTWNFQFWYRDPAGGPAGNNFSDGVSITFCP